MAEQAIGFNPEQQLLLVAQRWTGFSARREAFVLSVNDAVTGRRVGSPGQTAADFAAAAQQLAQWTVTERQARDHLERMGLPRQRPCPECQAHLPLGGLYCRTCGLNGTIPPNLQPVGPRPLTVVK